MASSPKQNLLYLLVHVLTFIAVFFPNAFRQTSEYTKEIVREDDGASSGHVDRGIKALGIGGGKSISLHFLAERLS
jgi:hypothetical protein